jgi:hypothetical protein
MAAKDLEEKGQSPPGSQSGRLATQRASSPAPLNVLLESGVGPSTAARFNLLKKEICWLAFAQDDGISKS